MEGCDAGKGEYRRDASEGGGCAPCPAGTSPSGGVGIADCEPCAPGTFYNASRRLCLACPAGSTTAWLGLLFSARFGSLFGHPTAKRFRLLTPPTME